MIGRPPSRPIRLRQSQQCLSHLRQSASKPNTLQSLCIYILIQWTKIPVSWIHTIYSKSQMKRSRLWGSSMAWHGMAWLPNSTHLVSGSSFWNFLPWENFEIIRLFCHQNSLKCKYLKSHETVSYEFIIVKFFVISPFIWYVALQESSEN